MPSRVLPVVSAIWVGCILILTLAPTGSSRGILRLNPAADIRRFAADGPQTLLVQVGGNMALFVPFGFFLPLSVPRLNTLARTTLCGASLSIAVETAQYVLPSGRYASTADVILNTVGTVGGFVLMRAVVKGRRG